MLSLFIYSSVAVFMIVGGQPTIDDDRDDGDNELADVVARLQAELAKLVAKNDRLCLLYTSPSPRDS